MSQENKSYRDELTTLVKAFVQAHPGAQLIDAKMVEGRLCDEDARRLHMELCRTSGMTVDQIITDWNSRSPEDDQW